MDRDAAAPLPHAAEAPGAGGDVPDGDACYRAVESRDPRFDGRFFTGVLTTGIYCRPVCPARTPLRRNVRFFRSAAAAAAAGFRPCRRCRPESAPGSPAWRGTGASVERALRLLDEDVLERGGVPELAARLGLGERQLRRLFRRHLGASPRDVAATRRLHLALRLLHETRLPITEVAFAAGYRSVRRFNAALHDAFGAPPRSLRRAGAGGEGGAAAAPGGALCLRLAFRPPLDAAHWEALLAFLAARAIPGVEAVADGVWRHAARAGGAAGVVEVRRAPGGDALLLHVPEALARGVGTLVARARRVFDLDADPATIATHLRRDAALRVHLPGGAAPRVPGAWDGFELAVRAVLGQQVSVARASALAGALVERFGAPLGAAAAPGVERLFPDPRALADAALEELGLPRARAGAIRALAGAAADGLLGAGAAPDPEALCALPGIGPWTAAYVALRSGDPDAFPASDLGLRRALGGAGAPPTPAEAARRAEAWRPWRSYAAVTLWSSAAAVPRPRPGAGGPGRLQASR